MSAVALIDELTAALAAVDDHDNQQLTAAGIPDEARLICGKAKIRTGAPYYEPDPTGIETLVVPVFDDGETIDLLAFALGKPAQWWLRRGAYWALGGDALDRLWLGDRLRIYRSPLSWLRAGAPDTGMVVLDWATARLHLPHVEIVAEDLDHGIELDRLLMVPAMHPLIHVPDQAAA